MPKKKNAAQKAASAAQAQPEESKAAANPTPEPAPVVEEQKAEPQIKHKPLQRKNSRFELTKTEDGFEEEEKPTLYRPQFGEATSEAHEKMWELMKSYIGSDSKSIQRSIVNHVEYTLARTRFNFDNQGAYQAAAYSVRDRLIEAWNDTQEFHNVSNTSPFVPFLITSYRLF